MPANSRQMRLGLFLLAEGHHVAAWRHPSVTTNAATNFNHYVEVARLAEEAKFDFLFVADFNGIRSTDPVSVSRTARSLVFEPLTLLSALAYATSRIGLIATASTTYNEPYHVARKFASLDLISGGRAGWNLVTSQNDAEAWNFGLDSHADHASRYDRASEFVDVVRGLWDSWEEGAIVNDQASGIFVDPEKLHVLDHRGPYFSVRGPLNAARSPQGRPVIVQAGSSETGIGLAARTADVIFTAQPSPEGARRFYAAVKQRLAEFGRQPNSALVMPGVSPVIGKTRAEAQAKLDELQELVHPAVGLSLLHNAAGGLDLSGYPLDEPLPADLPISNGSQSRQKILLEMARRENLTIRQLYLRIAGARGHRQLVGTPADIADELQRAFESGEADGFNIMPPILPDGLADFAQFVVPELQRRGLFRKEYEGDRLRDNLGLQIP